MLDIGRSLAIAAQDLGLDEPTGYRYLRAFTDLGLARYLTLERPGYWGLLSSAQLARLCECTSLRMVRGAALHGEAAFVSN